MSHHKTAATFTATDALKRKSPNDDDHHRGFTFLFSTFIFRSHDCKCYLYIFKIAHMHLEVSIYLQFNTITIFRTNNLLT